LILIIRIVIFSNSLSQTEVTQSSKVCLSKCWILCVWEVWLNNLQFDLLWVHMLVWLDSEHLITNVVNIYLNMFRPSMHHWISVSDLALKLSHHKTNFLDIRNFSSSRSDMIQVTFAVGSAKALTLYLTMTPLFVFLRPTRSMSLQGKHIAMLWISYHLW